MKKIILALSSFKEDGRLFEKVNESSYVVMVSEEDKIHCREINILKNENIDRNINGKKILIVAHDFCDKVTKEGISSEDLSGFVKYLNHIIESCEILIGESEFTFNIGLHNRCPVVKNLVTPNPIEIAFKYSANNYQTKGFYRDAKIGEHSSLKFLLYDMINNFEDDSFHDIFDELLVLLDVNVLDVGLRFLGLINSPNIKENLYSIIQNIVLICSFSELSDVKDNSLLGVLPFHENSKESDVNKLKHFLSKDNDKIVDKIISGDSQYRDFLNLKEIIQELLKGVEEDNDESLSKLAAFFSNRFNEEYCAEFSEKLNDYSMRNLP